MRDIKDAVIVGAGIAGLSAGWRLRHWDTVVLEADSRVGGRIRSERRGPYWLNWGAHVLAGPGSSTADLLREVGVSAVAIPGSLQAIELGGTLLTKGHLVTYPFRLPMTPKARAATLRAGLKLLPQIARYTNVVRTRAGESSESRQQRIYDFANDRSFAEFVGRLPQDAAELFKITVTRSAGTMDQISAGAGIGYFSLVLGIGQGLGQGIVGGPSTLTETIAAALDDTVQLGAAVLEVRQEKDQVVVTYRQGGVEREVMARTAVLATTADVSHRIGANLPDELRDALGRIKYGPHVSSAFLTGETGPRPWDDIYAIGAPGRSFAMALNQANLVRASEATRQPGGSFMTFSPADRGRALLDKSDDEVTETHLADLDDILGHGFVDSVTEAHAARWKVASPYCFPGRAALQPTLMHGSGRIQLAGDFLGTLYTESSISSGFTAAHRVTGLLTTDRQTGPSLIPPTDAAGN
jgi:oxygen-dependent protoporphyrinogen oxidase